MLVQETSLQAFFGEVLGNLGERQRVVLECLYKHNKPMTNTEIADALNWPINTVTPRMFELRQAKLVDEACKRKCNITGRNAIAWEIVQTTLF